jgi:predicted DNA binding CopG/RHH family protein
MSWLSSFLHPQKGYQKGQEQLDKYYRQSQEALQPYNQHGQEQYGNLNDYIRSLMNPQELQAKWTQGYETSPAAIQAQKMAQEHGLNAATSMGLGGSNTAINAIQSGTSQIGMEDRQNYLNDLMQKYLAGAGLVQGVYGTGANAASGQSNNAMNMGQNSAQMAYNRQNAGGNMLGGLIGQGLGLVGGYLGGQNPGKWNTTGGA